MTAGQDTGLIVRIRKNGKIGGFPWQGHSLVSSQSNEREKFGAGLCYQHERNAPSLHRCHSIDLASNTYPRPDTDCAHDKIWS